MAFLLGLFATQILFPKMPTLFVDYGNVTLSNEVAEVVGKKKEAIFCCIIALSLVEQLMNDDAQQNYVKLKVFIACLVVWRTFFLEFEPMK